MFWLMFACTALSQDDSASDSADTQDSDQTSGCRSGGSTAPALLVSHPFTSPPVQWSWGALVGETLELRGELEAGKATWGEVAWTPDGELAAAAQEDGSVALFRVLREGDEVVDVEVIDPGWRGEFYAGRVVVEPGGEAWWIVDPNTPENGGGLFRAPIDCESGEVGTPEKVRVSRLASDLLFAESGPVVVAAEVEGQAGQLHRLDPDWELVHSAAPLTYEGVYTDDGALGADGRVLFADTSAWSGEDTRVVVVDAQLTALHQVTMADPTAIFPVPGSDEWLALSAWPADELVLVGGDGQVLERLESPLPSSVSGNGELAVVAENQALRVLRFPGGTIEQVSRVPLSGTELIPGVVGLSP